RLRDESPYGTRNYGTEALTGRASLRDGTEALTGRASYRRRDLRDEPPSGTEALTGPASLRDGGAYGTTLLTGLVLRDDGTEELTGRLDTGRRRLRDASIRDSNYGTEGAYGTSFLYGTEARRASWDSFITDGGAYGTSLLMGLLIARRRDLRDEPPFRDGGAYGTSLLTRRDGGAYGTSFLRDGGSEALTGRTAYGTLNNGSEGLTGGAYETTLLTGLVLRDDRTEELTGRASLWDF
ncbi:unnamed protein product, partial [Symbiodinium microadriaticum]